MTLEQTTNPTSIPLTGLGYGPLANLYGQQLVPQSPIGNILSQLGPLAQLGPLTPYATNPQLALQAQLGAILSQVGHLQPYGVGQQFGLQNPIGGNFGQIGQLLPYLTGQQFGMQNPIAGNVGQIGQLLPYLTGQQSGMQSPIGGNFGQFGQHMHPFAGVGQQLVPQALIGAILSQLGPYGVNPQLVSPWGQITQNPFLNPYAQFGGGFRTW